MEGDTLKLLILEQNHAPPHHTSVNQLMSIFNPIGYQMETECTLMIISNKATNTPSSGSTHDSEVGDTRQR